MKAVIAGGGIGGLSTALCLLQHGWEVRVLEQAAVLESVGAGLQLSPNGCHVLRRLGLLEPLSEYAFAPECIEMRLGRSGRTVFSIPLQAYAHQRWGAPYLHIHRARLLDGLVQALQERAPGSLQCGQKVVGYTPAGSGVCVTTAGGETIEADLLVGADGIHSQIQAQMLGPAPPRFTGNVAWRMTVPEAHLGDLCPPSTACVWVGPGRHAVTYRLGEGLVNFVGVVEQADWSNESWTAEGNREHAARDFAGWHPVVTTLIEQARTHYQWALLDRAPLPRWTDGRVALLGDAAHPMLPFLAQGAVMAMEDAWVLAHCLVSEMNIAKGLISYQQARMARTARAQAGARANMRRFHHRNPLAYLPYWLAGRYAPGFVHGRQDWLYGVDVTHAPGSA